MNILRDVALDKQERLYRRDVMQREFARFKHSLETGVE